MTADVWSFDLQYPRPPIGLSQNSRAHWSVKNRSTQEVRLLVMSKVRALRLGELQKVSVQVIWVVGDRRKRDNDNPAPMLKAIYDGIGSNKGISAHLVPDDDPEHMDKLGLTIHYIPKASPHFRVLIRDLGDEVTL